MIEKKGRNNQNSKSRITKREIERKIAGKSRLENKDLKEILFKMKYNVSPELSMSILNTLDEQGKTFILGCPLPETYKSLRTIGNAPFKVSFKNEINWLFISLNIFHEDINLFLKYEKEFETSFLLGDYKTANNILNKIDSEICFSQWSLEKRLLLTEYSRSDAENKKILVEQIRCEAEQIIKISTSYISMRFEQQLPPNRYDEILEKFASKHRNIALSNYFLYKLNPYTNISIGSPELTLYLESNLSIIDRYLILIRTSLSILSTGEIDKVYIDSLKGVIPQLQKLIHDPRLLSMCVFLGLQPATIDTLVKDSYYDILNKYNLGDYTSCYQECLDEIRKRPYIIELAELLAKSAIILGKTSPLIVSDESVIDKIVGDLFSVFSKDEGYELSLYSLGKTAKSICSSIWCDSLVNIVNNEQSYNYENYDFNLHHKLSSSIISPDLGFYIFDESRLKQFKYIFKDEIFPEFIFWEPESLLKIEDSFPTGQAIRKDLSTAKKLQLNKNYNAAIEYLNNIFKTSEYKELVEIPFIRLEILKNKIYCYLQTDQYNSAIEVICETVLENNKFYLSLNYNELVAKVLSSNDTIIQSNICTPIIARLYKDKINDIWIAYDNFMYHNNFTFPKEIFNSIKFKEKLLIYFLRYVCIQDVYDSSPSFRNPDELDNQRIAICNYLCEKDTENKEAYVVEITETETKALIKKGIKEIDESKIYVDINGIWRQLELEIKERFTRGKELSKLSKEEIDYLLEITSSVLVLFVNKKDDEAGIVKFEKEELLDTIASHPHFLNFKENFLLIRDRFISSNEFGLDSYISMRIRHGTLLGQIRSIFEKFNLITKKNTHTTQYIENEYWINKICLNDKSKSVISEKLNTFSEKIDQMSEQIKNSLLQVKTEEKTSDGLFNYKYEDDDLIKLYESNFYNLETHNDFFEKAVETLWQRTEENLEFIRNQFKTEYCNRALTAIDELFSAIEKYKKKYNTDIDTNEFLRDITACKTDATIAFEKTSLWFRRSYSNSINEFDLKLVIDICFSIVNKMHPKTQILSPEILNTSTSIVNGQYFAFFIDIMRNILDNIIIRSELAEPELKVKLVINEDKGVLKINIENNVAHTVNLDVSNRTIATTQFRIDNNEGSPLLKTEGGSGYLKIKNIIKINLKRKKYTLQLEQIKEDRIFKSHLSFELQNLIKE